jgi:GNAT superfamily N-acetyltransferase
LETENELYLEITDDYKSISEFDTSMNYANIHDGKRFITQKISVYRGTETVAYLETHIFFDTELSESGVTHEQAADDELNDDAYEAMRILKGKKLLNRPEKSSLYFVLARWPISTVYLQHIAVREDFRKQGIGGWLLRNLPDILEINCKITPNVIIVKLYPESVTWRDGEPSFDPDLGDPDEGAGMFPVMKKLFEANGYTRHKNSHFFIKDFAY